MLSCRQRFFNKMFVDIFMDKPFLLLLPYFKFEYNRLTMPIPSNANSAVPKKSGNSLRGAVAGKFAWFCKWKKRYW